MKFHGPHMTNPADFDDPLHFPLKPPAGQVFHSSSETSTVDTN